MSIVGYYESFSFLVLCVLSVYYIYGRNFYVDRSNLISEDHLEKWTYSDMEENLFVNGFDWFVNIGSVICVVICRERIVTIEKMFCISKRECQAKKIRRDDDDEEEEEEENKEKEQKDLFYAYVRLRVNMNRRFFLLSAIYGWCRTLLLTVVDRRAAVRTFASSSFSRAFCFLSIT